MPDRTGRPWTDDERRILEFGWGEIPADELATQLDRTLGATRREACRRGLGPSGRGRLTISELARRTGYTWHQLRHGIKLAGVRPMVSSAGSSQPDRRLSEDQAAAVVDALGAETRASLEIVTLSGLVRESGWSESTVRRRARELGIKCGRGVVPAEDTERLRSALGKAEARADGLTTRQAAQFLCASVGMLEKWRHRGEGPPYAQPATHMVTYPRDEFVAWMSGHRVGNGSDPDIAEPLIATERAASLLGFAACTLSLWRCSGRGPAHYRLTPRLIRYARADVEAFA